MAVCVARTPCARLEGEEACSLPKSQDHSGHRLGRDPLRRRGRHHHLLLPLLLLLPLPPAPAAAEPVRRPGDPHDRRPCAATVPIPPGPQSWPRTPTAWLHVPTQRSCTPVSTLPGGTPRLQPCSSSPVRATPALLPWSLRSQLRLCRPSEAEPPPGPGGGQGHLLARPQAQLHPETFWEWSPREEEQELSWDSAVTEGRVGRAWDTRTIFIRSGGRAGKPAWPLLSPALLPGRRPGRLGPSCSSAVDGGEGGAGLGRLHQPWAEAPPPAAPRPALGGIKAKVT
ncbi:protein shisa-4 isoform X1 [Ovis aries]|uniref:protein shisa-4 isoform X1 n=1 Tax=Ovis aries TaxID=9940 RepID=UPI001C2E8856|nr:protein shisa-4 isoform X1 [Ovis aries]